MRIASLLFRMATRAALLRAAQRVPVRYFGKSACCETSLILLRHVSPPTRIIYANITLADVIEGDGRRYAIMQANAPTPKPTSRTRAPRRSTADQFSINRRTVSSWACRFSQCGASSEISSQLGASPSKSSGLSRCSLTK